MSSHFNTYSIFKNSSKELGGGTILDLGIYTLQLVQFVYKGLTHVSASAKGTLNSNGVDESSSAIISYKNGKIAIVSTHSRVELPNEACIVGTKGTIKVCLFNPALYKFSPIDSEVLVPGYNYCTK